MHPIQLDGSYGEGGGQILRTSLSLSAITQKPFTIHNIRSNRAIPGLAPQHLMACQSVRRVCRGSLINACLNSTELTFEPGEIVGGEYEFDIGTAGSIPLVAQTLIPIFLCAKKASHFRIIGGTHVTKSPGYDYFAEVFLPAVRQFGAQVQTNIIQSGYFPKGGGIVEIQVKPSDLSGCKSWQTPAARTAHSIIRLSRLPSHIAAREKQVLIDNNIHEISIIDENSFSAGNAITVWKGFKGVYVLGERGKRAEIVAQEAANLFHQFDKDVAEVDPHLGDQLLIYAVLAQGETQYTTIESTEHLRTNAYVINLFTERKIKIEDNKILIE